MIISLGMRGDCAWPKKIFASDHSKDLGPQLSDTDRRTFDRYSQRVHAEARYFAGAARSREWPFWRKRISRSGLRAVDRRQAVTGKFETFDGSA
ncbi:hypothetical protein GNZ12_40840 [Paraburkholderia sp. 1N]|uniref:Uncharacterized protein n=1 Tax=Paraburkholderia solitsugae TaxID=2675748 RepID=A0ABX2C626_9BURK|nr:hypothetical protein [Paraburkholderia solitsugae]NPT47530.1 hypothetical protein [Paraburkholderia solitsugae]